MKSLTKQKKAILKDLNLKLRNTEDCLGKFQDVLVTKALIKLKALDNIILPRIDHNCTTAKMAEQLNIPLWKVMELGKYFKKMFKIQDKGE